MDFVFNLEFTMLSFRDFRYWSSRTVTIFGGLSEDLSCHSTGILIAYFLCSFNTTVELNRISFTAFYWTLNLVRNVGDWNWFLFNLLVKTVSLSSQLTLQINWIQFVFGWRLVKNVPYAVIGLMKTNGKVTTQSIMQPCSTDKVGKLSPNWRVSSNR